MGCQKKSKKITSQTKTNTWVSLKTFSDFLRKSENFKVKYLNKQ